MPKPLLIDDAVVRRLLKLGPAVRAFWFLRSPPKTTRPACCGRAGKTAATDVGRIKQLIAGLGPADQKTLLAALGVPAARVIYRSGSRSAEAALGG